MQYFPALFALGVSILLTACGTTGVAPGGRKPLTVVETGGHRGLSAEHRGIFSAQLNESLFGEDGAFTPTAGGSVLRWQALEADEGSRVLRYFVGFGAGRGVFRTRGTLVAPGGRAVASTEVEGTQTVGIYGGSYDSALLDAADDLAEWATTHASSLPRVVERERPW